MSEITCVTTQAELDAALVAEKPRVWIVGAGRFIIGGSAHVVARDSAHVEAWDSAHVVASGSAHVEAWGSAHVVAWDSAHVEAWGSAHVEAGSQVAVHRHAKTTTVTGGVVIEVTRPTTAENWCAWYAVPVVDGVATLYKGVRDDYRSARGGDYTPGSVPVASDWDGGEAECGGGLHFSPRPAMTLSFDGEATRFLACPVRLSDMRVPQADDDYPQKIKARGCCGPVVEVDRWGAPVQQQAERR